MTSLTRSHGNIDRTREDKERRNEQRTNKDNRRETKTRSEMTGSIPSGVPHFMFLIIEQSHVYVRSLVLGKVVTKWRYFITQLE